MPEFDFDKVVLQLCSPVNLLHILEHLFLGTPLEGCFCVQLKKGRTEKGWENLLVGELPKEKWVKTRMRK